MAAIYKIRNTINEHFYIGSSVNERTRFMSHRFHLKRGTHHCQALQRAWVKHGADAFKFEVIERVEEVADLLILEEQWLRLHHGKRHCYNSAKHAESPFLGLRHTNETKGKLSLAHRGMKHRLGHTSSPEHRQKISAAMSGKKKTPEHAEKIRQRMIGTSYAKGRIVTEEMRAAQGRSVEEITQGLEFTTVAAAALHFGLSRPNVVRALRSEGPLKRGPKRGLHFQYLEKHSLPTTPD